MARVKILFKVNGDVKVEESADMELKAIEKMKLLVAEECGCSYHDVEIEKMVTVYDLSEEIDVTGKGMMFFNDLHKGVITGVECCLQEGSDKFLDVISRGKLHEYINFSV